MEVSAPERLQTQSQSGIPAGGDSRSLAPTALIVAAALAIGSIIPILRDALVAARLGASVDGDAYFLSTYVSIMLVTIFVSESTVPAAVVTLSSADRDDERGGWRLSAALIVAGVGLSALALAVAFLSQPLARILAPGFDSEAISTTADSIVATAPVIVLLGMAWLVAAWLNARGRFVLPSLVTPLVAIGACIPLLKGNISPPEAAFGWTIGAGIALATLLLIGCLTPGGADVHTHVKRIHKRHLAAAMAIAAPLLLLTIVTQSTEIVDRVIASHVGAGAVTTVSLAKKTIVLPSTILVAAVGTVVLPFISRREALHERADAFGRTLNLSLFFLLPTAAFLVLLREDVVRVLYGRGEFDANDVSTTAMLLGLYAVALIPTNIGVVLQRTFATLGGIEVARLPLYPYAIVMGCYIPLAWFGARLIGLRALPIAFGVAEMVYVVVLIVALQRRLKFRMPHLAWPASVALIATLVASAVVVALSRLQISSVFLSTGISLAGGAATYAALVAWLGHPAATDILDARHRGTPEPDRERLRVGLDVTYAGTRDGTGRYGSSLEREMSRRTDIELIRFRAPRVERIPRPVRLPLNGLVHLFWIQFVAPVWAWRRRIDVLHMATTAPFISPCPVVVTIHDGLDFYPDLRPSRIWSAYVRWIGARAARRADGIVTVSQASAIEISREYRLPLARIHVVMHGSELSTPAVEVPRFSEVPYVLMVASATRRKNFETAYAAVDCLRNSGRMVDFVVVGVVPVGNRARPWLHMLAGIDDAVLAGLYSGACAVIIPSRHEGFGLPAIEALALGTPVVASDIPALREVTCHATRYAPTESAEAFAAEIGKILDDRAGERERIAVAVTFARSLSWARAAEQSIAVYRSVLVHGSRERVWKSLSTVGSRPD